MPLLDDLCGRRGQPTRPLLKSPDTVWGEGRAGEMNVWSFLSDKDTLSKILPVFLTFALGLIATLFSAKPKIKWSIQHNNVQVVNEGEQSTTIFTREIFLKNVGRTVAEEIEFALNYRPLHLSIYPHVPYQIITNPEGRVIVTFDKLNPNEFVFINLLNTRHELPNVTGVRFKGGVGRQIEMVPQVVYPKWVAVFVLIIMFIGVVTLLYFITYPVINYLF